MNGRSEGDLVDQESLEQRDEHANGEGGAHGPSRQPVPGDLDAEHDRGEQRDDPQERRAGQVIRAADVNAAGDDGDAEDEEGKSLSRFVTVEVMVRL
jgi:hypothetical protein